MSSSSEYRSATEFLLELELDNSAEEAADQFKDFSEGYLMKDDPAVITAASRRKLTARRNSFTCTNTNTASVANSASVALARRSSIAATLAAEGAPITFQSRSIRRRSSITITSSENDAPAARSRRRSLAVSHPISRHEASSPEVASSSSSSTRVSRRHSMTSAAAPHSPRPLPAKLVKVAEGDESAPAPAAAPTARRELPYGAACGRGRGMVAFMTKMVAERQEKQQKELRQQKQLREKQLQLICSMAKGIARGKIRRQSYAGPGPEPESKRCN